jgi:riboflavin transporter FmnP
VAFVLPAGIIYKKTRTLKGAIIASIIGALSAGALSVFINFYIIYPLYINVVHYPLNEIIKAYSAINPSINSLWQAIIIFNMPFTFLKEMCNVAITFLLYKRISPFLRGKEI